MLIRQRFPPTLQVPFTVYGSLCCADTLLFPVSHQLMVSVIPCARGLLCRKSLPIPVSLSIFPMLSSKSFSVLTLQRVYPPLPFYESCGYNFCGWTQPGLLPHHLIRHADFKENICLNICCLPSTVLIAFDYVV